MIVSDAPNCGVTYDRHYDDHNSFIIQATGSIIYWVAIYGSFAQVEVAKRMKDIRPFDLNAELAPNYINSLTWRYRNDVCSHEPSLTALIWLKLDKAVAR